MFRRLAYVSRLRENLPLVEISRIVAVCRAQNEADAITGVLLFTGNVFAQLIEGDPASVEVLWCRIRADPRHRDITVLLDEQGSSPWFSDWRMGYVHDRAQVEKLSDWHALEQILTGEDLAALRSLFTSADAF